MKKILNKRNGIIAGAAVIIIAIAIVVTTSFSSAMTLDEAKAEAKKYVPDTAEFKGSDEDLNNYEVYFYDATNQESFEVEVHKDSKAVKKIERQLDNDLGSATVVLTEAQVEAIVKENFQGVTSVTITLAQDNGLYEYEASFRASDFYGTADINPETGVILESEVKFGTATVIPKDDPADTSDDKDDADDTDDDATENNNSGNQSNTSNGSSSSGSNSSSGSSSSGGQSTTSLISADKARSIVLGKIPGATIVSMELDTENGIRVYEGEARLNGVEYDFEINAASGVIVKWEQERIDDDDDDRYDYRDDDDDDDDDLDD